MFYRALKKKEGFTLVELMVVVVIIGILAAVAIPTYNNVTFNAAKQAHNANVRTLIGAGYMYVANEGPPESTKTFTGDKDDEIMKYIESWPENPLPAGEQQAGDYEITITATGEVSCNKSIVE